MNVHKLWMFINSEFSQIVNVHKLWIFINSEILNIHNLWIFINSEYSHLWIFTICEILYRNWVQHWELINGGMLENIPNTKYKMNSLLRHISGTTDYDTCDVYKACLCGKYVWDHGDISNTAVYPKCPPSSTKHPKQVRVPFIENNLSKWLQARYSNRTMIYKTTVFDVTCNCCTASDSIGSEKLSTVARWITVHILWIYLNRIKLLITICDTQ